MSIIIILIIIFGTGLSVAIFFVVKSVMAPKRVTTLADFVKQNKNAQAVRMAKQILAKEPRNSEAHYLLAKALEQDGKAELALMELKTVGNINDFKGYCKENEFRPNIARLYDQFNFPEEALKEYLLLIKMEPHNPDFYFNAGKLFEKRNKGAQAAQYYKKTIDMDPRNSEAHFNLGTLLYKGKRYNDAKIILAKAIKLRPDNYKAHFFLGRMHKETQNYTSAIQSFEQAQKDSEFKVKALIERGICYIAINNYDKGATELERAVKLTNEKPDDSTLFARYYLAMCHEKQRNIDKAIEQWEKIYAVKQSFKDVAEKLSQFQDLRENDSMKDFLTSSNQNFLDLCKKILEGMNLSISDQSLTKLGCQVIATEKSTGQWRNTKKMPILIHFYRITDNIDQPQVREFNEEIQTLKASRGIMITSFMFTRAAKEFTESRPIDFIDKTKLQEYLDQAVKK
ncbi:MULTISPECIES: tetratricopeptide repeat protein [unclassified Oceanispirochaeta]|uniref:tetratricopeptide repeat protein n=1 Tax=unclassified Oceanispirochaeta TaxID=2635722 RepID=UPI000E09AD9C|nr:MULTISPECIES: tetratricopeptide repeat protein [unclassified Oceanispirochaeta]MBF9016836.1 tetratricopeptide repeat protein [Oceanispirochaeta sp. M2]NPD73199.1 tetratricopeptide repeat protein [Oceanispirochaeta sp. M1]RDG31067.1 tetratricopeptide repeat protein [Oceanispirochaeta sp. M1]